MKKQALASSGGQLNPCANEGLCCRQQTQNLDKAVDEAGERWVVLVDASSIRRKHKGCTAGRLRKAPQIP